MLHVNVALRCGVDRKSFSPLDQCIRRIPMLSCQLPSHYAFRPPAKYTSEQFDGTKFSKILMTDILLSTTDSNLISAARINEIPAENSV